MYSFFLMANIQNNSPYRIIHSHRMTLSRQKNCFSFQAWDTASIAFLSSVVSGSLSLPVAVVGGLVDVERQDLKLKYAMPNVISTSGRFCTSHACPARPLWRSPPSSPLALFSSSGNAPHHSPNIAVLLATVAHSMHD